MDLKAVSWLWIIATIIAALAQVIRNSLQKKLTHTLGVMGATQVRFVFGLPFSVMFLVIIVLLTGEALPSPNTPFLIAITWGAIAQIAATAMMLTAMRLFSLAHVTAFTKTEPLQVALFAWLFLGENLPWQAVIAMIIAVMGVFLMSFQTSDTTSDTQQSAQKHDARLAAIGWGLLAGGAFALAAIGARAGITALESGSFLVRASVALVGALSIQTCIMIVYLMVFDRVALFKSFKVWRSSALAGLMGAFASQFWFIGFSLVAAAQVRTLALVEVLFALCVSVFVLREPISARVVIGVFMIVCSLVAFGFLAAS